MNKKLLLFLLLISGIQSFAQAQSASCAADEANNYLKARDPGYATALQRQIQDWVIFNQQGAGMPQGLVSNGVNGPVYEIPVVFHIIHTGQGIGAAQNPTDATIQTLVSYLNSVYAATWASNPDTNNGGVNVPIRFKLAARTPACLPTTGINRVNGSSVTGYTASGLRMGGATSGGDEVALKALSIWPNTAYLNIWIVTNIQGAAANGGGVAGFAYYPGAGPDVDGVVLRYDQTNWAIAHEVGHSLGLRHSFEGSSNATTCPTNTNCVSNGDLVCDTDPHPLLSGCPTGTNPCTNTSYVPVTYNIMNYTSCPNRFSVGQRTRMVNQLLTWRNSLTTSLGVLPPGTFPTNFAAPVTACVPTGISMGGYNIGPNDVSLGNMSYFSEGYTGDGNSYYINHTANTCLAGQSVANLTAGTPYALSVTPGANNGENTKAWIDWNNDGTFQATEQVLSVTGSINTAGQVAVATVTPPATAVTCTPLRLRVFSDFYGSTVPAPCANPVYGQVEDFTVIVSPAAAALTVAIASSATGAICANTSVTFTAVTTNAVSPVYQWKKNGVATGTNAATYTNASWTNNDVITLQVTSTSGCSASTIITNSNAITMAVNPTVTPSITISANPGNIICAGTPATFTAVPLNAGTGATIQWKKNGSNVGVNSTTYTDNGLLNSDAITAMVTSIAGCASPATVTSSAITMTVNPVVVPSVTVAANTGTTICAGTIVTFMATPVNGGATPAYQWKKNSINVGTNLASYTDNTLLNTDVVSVVLTGNAGCASSPTATGSVTMAVNSTVIPAVSVSANTGNSICAGTSVSFTATPANGGTAPAYQWKKNGANIATGLTWTTNTLATGDQVSVVLTSNAGCANPLTASSPLFTMNVGTTLIPAVTIASSVGSTICAGTPATFTATPVNGGAAPAYQWKKNGINAGSNAATYTDNSLVNSDVISVVLTSNAACANPSTATAAGITMTVNPSVTPSVSISANPGTAICAGTSVTFTAAPVNGGTTPAYQWKKNNVNVGTNAPAYTDNGLSNSDVITAILTSNAACASANTVPGNALTLAVNPAVTPAVSVSSGITGTICAGTMATFTAVPVNGGTAPSYQWKVNNVNAGANSPVFSGSSFANGDVVTVVLTGNAPCATSATATGNAPALSVVPTVTAAVSISPSPNDTVCAGTPLTFTATPVNGGTAPVYAWKRNGITTGANAATYTQATPASGDLITLQMTSSAACAANAVVASNTIQLFVNPLPVPVIAKTGQVLNVGAGYTSYQWYFNGTAIPGSVSDTTRASRNGSYTVTVTDSKGCTGTSVAFINSNVGIGITGGSEVISFYPNPTRGILNIQSSAGPVSVRIFTIEGREVMRKDEVTKVDISNLPDALYTIQIRSKSGILLKTAKLTKAAY